MLIACFVAWELPAASVVSRAGVGTTLIAFAMFVVGLWGEMNSDSYWQTTCTFIAIAMAGAHGSLISLARLGPRHQWLRPASLVCSAFLVAAVCAALWSHRPSQATFKWIAVLAILDTALTLAIGALHFLGRNTAPAGGVAEVCFCPGCGRRLWQPAGEVRCHHCKAAYYVELRPAGDLPTAIARE
jgi:hypothetical protein